MYKGSCLCGEVKYTVEELPNAIGHCHCKICQKFHGAPFGTYTKVSNESFKFTKGADSVRTIRSSSSVTRSFCKACGTPLQFMPDKSRSFGLVVATLDEQPDKQPSYQIWTSSKLPWWDLDEALLSHETEP